MAATKKAAKPASTKEYLATLTPAQRKVLKAMRGAILSVAPDAEEHFSYGMPGFRLDDKTLVWYAAWSTHYAMYPIGPKLFAAHAAHLDGYTHSKGTIRFPLDKPLSIALVKKLVKGRVADIRDAWK